MNYKRLEVWIHAVDLAVEVYEISETFPPEERFGLTVQMRAAAVSIASNIAEGEGRGTPKDHLRFLADARGSVYELETQLIISRRLGFLRNENVFPKLETAAKLINATIRSIHRRMSQ